MERGIIEVGDAEDLGITNPTCMVEVEQYERANLTISGKHGDINQNQNGDIQTDAPVNKVEQNERENATIGSKHGDGAIDQNGDIQTEVSVKKPKYEPVEFHNDIDDTTCTINVDGTDTQSPDPLERNGHAVRGTPLSFHDIQYTVEIKEGRCRKTNKMILKGISGVFRPGLNAIMGPTGGGKTTLLDVLAARNNPHGLTGKVLMDGKPLPSNFRLISGYVVQDDVVMGTLSVRENLAFSAALRLPSSISKAEKADRVEEVIAELGLQDCAETRVGTQLIKGVSGGERKRTSIGMELIIQPSILFMDEPTTGLDASTAGSIMAQLARLTQKGRTIILSIHQPRYKIYRLFDRLHLLAHGETVYHGETKHAMQFFIDNGYIREENDNPADFMLDCIIVDQRPQTESSQDVRETTGSRLCNHDDPDAIQKSTEILENRHRLIDCFQNSEHYSHMKTEVDTLYEKYKLEDDVIYQQIVYKTSFLTQFNHIGRRAFLNYIRNPTICIKSVILVTVFALFIGMLYFQLDGAAENAIQDRTGALFFIAMHVVFMNINAMDAFIAERVIFLHESSSGYYRTSAYFLGKLVCDLIPQRTIPTLVYGSVAYWMIGLHKDTTSFLVFLSTILFSVYTWSALFLFFGAFVTSLVEGIPFIGLSIVTALMFSGFLLNMNSIFVGIAWLKHLSPIRYSLHVLFANELSGKAFCDGHPSNSTCAYGNIYLEQQDVDHSTWGIWKNQLILATMAVIFLTLTYIKLRTMPKYK